MKIIEDQNNGGDRLAILRVFSSHSCLGQGHYSVVLLSRQEKPAKTGRNSIQDFLLHKKVQVNTQIIRKLTKGKDIANVVHRIDSKLT